jgi:hypothetical protein
VANTGKLQKGTTPIVKRDGTLKDCHAHDFINFLGMLAYLAFFGTLGCLNSNLNCVSSASH